MSGPAGRVSPHAAVLLFIALFAAVVGVGLYGDELASLGRRPAPTLDASRFAVTSPTPTRPPPETATPAPVCEPAAIEPLSGPIDRQPGPLVPTAFVPMTAPSEADGSILIDGHGIAWSYGSGRLARLDDAGHVERGWSVADDARFGAISVAPALGGGVWLVSEATHEIAWFDGRGFRDIVPTPDETYAVVEATDGSLWAAINGGNPWVPGGRLAHWDGVRWTSVCTEVQSAWIDRLALDGRGDLWILAYDDNGQGEASRFDGRSWTSYKPDTERALPVSAPRAIVAAPDGAVWLGFDTGLARFDGTSWTRHDAPAGIDLRGMTALVVDRDGVAWIGAGMLEQAPYSVGGVHVVRFDGRSWRQFEASDGLPAAARSWSAVVTSLAIEPRGAVAVTPRGLFGLSGDRWGRIDHHAAPLDVAAMTVMSADEAWVATSVDGLWHYRKGRWVRDNPPGALGWPRALARGPGDTIAFATDRQIAIRAAGRWSVVLEADGDLGPMALAFAPDGRLWASIGQASSLVAFKSDGGRWARQPVEPGPSNVAPMTIGFDAAGDAWLIGDGWAPRSVRLVDGRWEDITVGDGWIPVGGMAVDPDGTVWLPLHRGETEAAIGAFDGRAWRVIELDQAVSYLSPKGIVALPDGSLLVGGSQGIVRYDGRRWGPLLLGAFVDIVGAGPDGAVWVAGSVGLGRLEVASALAAGPERAGVLERAGDPERAFCYAAATSGKGPGPSGVAPCLIG